MGKGEIISSMGAGQYQLRVKYDRTVIDREVELINRFLGMCNDRINALIDGDPDKKLPMLKLRKASLEKQLAYYLDLPPDPEIPAWCADYTDGLSGMVGTIEINGEADAGVNIRPGYPVGDAIYSADRDGQSMDTRAMTAWQAFYNMAMAPGWQKWMPTYRYGTIVSMGVNICNVRLDDAASGQATSGTGPLYINQAYDLVSVPIHYMTCNGGAFLVGDRVIIQFMDQSFSNPRVIGFERNPRECDALYYFQAYTEGTSVFLGVYDYLGQVVFVYDLNEILGNPPDTPIYVVDGHTDSNSVFVVAGEIVDGLMGYWTWRLPIIWYWSQQVLHKVMGTVNAAVPGLNALSAGGLRVHGIFNYSSSSSSLFATLFVTQIEQVWGTAMLQIKAALWTDSDNDYVVDPGEVYPSDYEEFWAEVRGVAWDNDTPRIIMGLWIGRDSVHPHSHVQDDAHIERCSIASFLPNTSESGIQYFTAAQNWVEAYWDHDILQIPTVAEFLRIDQLFYFDSRLFVFRNKPASLTMYSMDGATLAVASCAPAGEEEWCSMKAAIVRKGSAFLLAVQWATMRETPNLKTGVYLLDLDTLEVHSQLSFPGGCLPIDIRTTGTVVMQPVAPSFLIAVNRYRVAQGSMPISYSQVAAVAAQEHADWCVANNRLSHIGADGKDVHMRLYEKGIFMCAENLATAFVSDPVTEYAQVIDGWASSPGHRANLIYADDVSMGFGIATYPESCHVIVVGPGMYVPETGEYTTADSDWVVPVEMYGKVRAYVYNSCVF